MKLHNILAETVKGSWTVHNMVGEPKKFDDPHSTEARAWARSHERLPDKAADRDERARERAWLAMDKADEREEAKRQRLLVKAKKDTQMIWNNVQEAIGSTFPDGDPIDKLGPWMRRSGFDIHDIDAAVKKHAGKKKTGDYGLYDYLADMWDDSADDALHDAENGRKHDRGIHVPDTSVFINFDEGRGKYKKASNPWK